MPQSVGALLQDRAARLAGRERERHALAELLDEGGPLVAYVHGLAGVGKSTLLHAFAATARGRGAAVVELDGHAVYATRGAFLTALAELTGAVPDGASDGADPDGAPSPQHVANALAAQAERVVLVIDGYELFLTLDQWLCRTFVPSLPANVRVVFGGREQPAEAWRTTYGPALRVLALGNLPPEDAVAMLRERGVADAALTHVNAIARGHPLSLQLAAEALRDRPTLRFDAIAVGAVGEELARLYLDGLDPATRRALDAASLTRRTTLSVLEAMLPDDDAATTFERLRRLPFVVIGHDGLVVHDTVREATSALLRATNPDAYWRMRAAAWSRLRSELRGAPPRDVGRYTADMLYLIEEQAVRRVFFPPAVGEQAVEPARPDDWPALEEIGRRHMEPGERELLPRWWEAARDGFLVARDDDGTAIGFALLVEPRTVSPRLLEDDPVACRWREHLRRERPPRDQRALFLRYIAGGEVGSVAGAALLIEVTRKYVELRPELRRVYARARDFHDADETCSLVMGYLPLEEQPETVCVDFGPASVDGWLDELGQRELRVAAGAASVDPDERRLQLDGVTVDLTRLEAELLGCLQRRSGAAVPRATLLQEVWGTDWTGGSNVVDVVVSSLRRKLGDRAGALETVRGVGYRLRALG
ncbi:winged helix-turn-helix domain-containing protein [Conexibacter stalactiti]|uniref:Winged helix-turn-helix domain-containing protein n=1 Tax=Conexibacter stalactiti TaxID=1940611 RepID=A0ABU4HUW0_9ACTN|nr:winged helix-turn-helix domain-containing protein [Conexibacter stalactiti]MDW5597115.1 winged helix-turn-helix domain-containing protein [Conexibacter stalactiti]MEC5037757.1 winged helix-turn-helix domain-containing protein [Conexibacter stalactiti]